MEFIYTTLMMIGGALIVCVMAILAISMVIMLGVLICLTARSLWQTPWRFGLRSLFVVVLVWCSALGILRVFDASQSLILLITRPIIVALLSIPLLDYLQEKGTLKPTFDLRSFREAHSGLQFSTDEIDWASVSEKDSSSPINILDSIESSDQQNSSDQSTSTNATSRKVKWWLKPHRTHTHIGRYSFRTPD